MSTIAFDTHALIESLIKDGIEKKQAESIVKAIQVSREFDMSNLATKADIIELKAATKNDLLALENKLIYWIIGNSLAIIAILSGLKIFGGG
jgi:hypothetical protein